MKKTILALLIFCMVGVASAQTEKPERIVTFVKEMHNAAWYAHQADLWEKEVNRNPGNDDAWYFWFTATRYRLIFDANEHNRPNQYDEAPLKSIASRLHRERPKSFARYIIDHECEHLLNDCEGLEDHMIQAIRMRPDFKELYPVYVGYLLANGKDDMMADILKQWYDTGEYSYVLLSYAYNSLAGMEKNGILFVYGDVPTYSSLLVQFGKGLFRDKLIINRSLLFIPEYRDMVCSRLGVKPFEAPDDNSNDGLRKWEADLIFSIAHNTGRPVYFSSLDNQPQLEDHLYSEGLVMRYSTRRYDNLSVKRRNFESVYFKDYLYETFVPETYNSSAYRTNLNYIPCFKSLLTFYKTEGLKKEYDELHSLMMHILSQCEGIEDDAILKHYYDEIER